MANKRGRPAGYIMSDKSKQKISDKLKGRKITKQHRKRLSKSMISFKLCY